MTASSNAGRTFLDGVSQLSETVASYTAAPVKMASDTLSDAVIVRSPVP